MKKSVKTKEEALFAVSELVQYALFKVPEKGCDCVYLLEAKTRNACFCYLYKHCGCKDDRWDVALAPDFIVMPLDPSRKSVERHLMERPWADHP
jgi:hypothetical protein